MNLKKLRIISKLSQMKLAQKAGISQCHLSQIERGAKQPTLPVLKKLAAGLEISVAELIEEEGEPEKDGVGDERILEGGNA